MVNVETQKMGAHSQSMSLARSSCSVDAPLDHQGPGLPPTNTLPASEQRPAVNKAAFASCTPCRGPECVIVRNHFKTRAWSTKLLNWFSCTENARCYSVNLSKCQCKTQQPCTQCCKRCYRATRMIGYVKATYCIKFSHLGKRQLAEFIDSHHAVLLPQSEGERWALAPLCFCKFNPGWVSLHFSSFL